MTAEILLITLFFLFLIHTPIAIAIGASSVAAILIQGDFPLMMVVQRMVAGTDSFHLMAVPLFMYAGVIMERGGISQRLIEFANALTGWLPGGLAAVSIVSAMFFAGISGSAAADAAAVGAVLIPAMKRSGYPSDFSAAVQASGGSLGVVIPPSIPMIIFGFLTGASISRLFAAGILPGLLIGFSLICCATLIAWKRGYAPHTRFSPRLIGTTFRRAILALGAPVIILGGILFGIFTATESAAVAVVYALFVSMAVYRKIRFSDLFSIFGQAGITASVVMFIIATAGFFGWLMIHQSIPEQVISGLTTITENRYVLLIIVVCVLIILGCFLEGIAVMVITIPIFMKVIDQFQIDPIQFGVIMVLCSMIGLLTPPVGMSLYAVATISNVSIGRLTRELFPYLLGIFIVTLMITYIPMVSLWLPNILMPE